MTLNKHWWVCVAFLFVSVTSGFPQQPAGAPIPAATLQPVKYLLGPSDELEISSDATEVNGKSVRVSPGGDISLPFVGDIHVTGMTTLQLQAYIVEKLKVRYVSPHVSVNMTQLRSQPVYVSGAVNSNGRYQLEGKKTLGQVISEAGGPRTDAGYRVIITRRRENGAIPLPSNKLDAAANVFIAEVKLRNLLNATNPEEDIELLAEDSILVPPGEIIYVSGAVNKPGGFVLGDEATISTQRLIALANGTKRTAKLKEAVILRQTPGGKLDSIAINLKDVKDKKVKDVELQPKDILVIEDSAANGTIRSTAGNILQTVTGMAIYRIP